MSPSTIATVTATARRAATSPSALIALATIAVLSCMAAFAAPAPAQSSSQNERCMACHGQPDAGQITVDGQTRSLTVSADAYAHSRHSLIDCTGCHIGFKADKHTDAEAQDWLWTARVGACGDCHADVMSQYAASSHGRAVLARDATTNAPACATCHGSHAIVDPTTPAFHKVSMDICAGCHGGRSTTFLDTYHGKALLLGRPDAATCTDCHTAHHVLPASDPASSVSSQNIVATCQKCHPGANSRFASYQVHIQASDPRDSKIVFLTYLFYAVLITAVFTFGGIHSFMYFWRGRKEGMYARHD